MYQATSYRNRIIDNHITICLLWKKQTPLTSIDIIGQSIIVALHGKIRWEIFSRRVYRVESDKSF